MLKPRKWSEKEWKRRWPNSIERYSAIHKNVYKELDPTAQEYFEKTLAFMNEQGKTPVIVLTPVNPKLRKILGPLGWDDRHEEVVAYVESLQGEYDFVFIDMTDPSLFDYDKNGVVRRRAHDDRQHAGRPSTTSSRSPAACRRSRRRQAVSRPGGVLLNSYTFLLVFLPVVVVLYWLVPRGYPRMLFLIAASLVFYGLWDWRYIPLLLATTLVDWVAGHYLATSEAEGASRRRKLILAAAVTINLALLGYFKYRGFFVDSLDGILSLVGAGRPLPAMKLLLPIGISFYTFAGISYAVDMFRGQYKPAKSVIHYLAWVTLFPVHPRRADHPLRPRGRAAGALAAALPLGARRQRPLLHHHGPGQEDAGRRHDGALREQPVLAPRPPRPLVRLGRRPRLHAAALLRLLRLQRHGRGRRPADRPPVPAELRLAVQGGQPVGLLAPLAHDPVRLAARLPVHPARRVARRRRPHRAQPAPHLPARRALARPRLDVRLLGPALGRVPVGPRALQEVRVRAAVGVAQPHPHLRRRHRGLGVLPRLVHARRGGRAQVDGGLQRGERRGHPARGADPRRLHRRRPALGQPAPQLVADPAAAQAAVRAAARYRASRLRCSRSASPARSCTCSSRR